MTRPVWRVERVTPAPRRWWQWWRRREVTTFHRCLAVSMYFADPKNSGALR